MVVLLTSSPLRKTVREIGEGQGNCCHYSFN